MRSWRWRCIQSRAHSVDVLKYPDFLFLAPPSLPSGSFATPENKSEVISTAEHRSRLRWCCSVIAQWIKYWSISRIIFRVDQDVSINACHRLRKAHLPPKSFAIQGSSPPWYLRQTNIRLAWLQFKHRATQKKQYLYLAFCYNKVSWTSRGRENWQWAYKLFKVWSQNIFVKFPNFCRVLMWLSTTRAPSQMRMLAHGLFSL